MTTPPPDGLGAAAAHGVRWVTLARVGIELVLLGSMVVLARLIPPAEFGAVAVAILAGELALLVPAEGVGTALVQRAAVGREHLQAGLALALLTGLAIVGLTLLAASLIVEPLFGEHTANLVRLATPGFMLGAAGTVPMAILRRRLAFRRISVIEIVNNSIRSAACVGLALAGLDGEALVIGGIAGGLVAFAVTWASAPAPLPWLRLSAARDLLGYGLPASLASVSWVGFRNSDYAIIGARLGAVEAGYYFRAYQLAVEYQKKISLVMGQVGFPVLARAESAEQRAAIRTQMVRMLTILLFPLLAVLAIVAPVLVPWAFGPAWAPAALPTQILALGGAATLVIDAAGVAFMAAGRARALLGFGWAHFLVYAPAVLVVAPLGLAAVAAAAAVVHTLFLFVAYVMLFRGTGVNPVRQLWLEVAPATLSCVGLAAVGVPVGTALSTADAPALVQLAAVTLAAAAAYLLTLRVCFPAAWADLRAFVARVLPDQRLSRFTRRLAPASAP
jgi:PST family polysaccharide transporter